MFERTKLGWRLVKQSMRIFLTNKKLLIFPIVGRGCFLLMVGGMSFWFWLQNYRGVDITHLSTHTIVKIYLLVPIILFVSNLLAVFMTATLAVCTIEYYAGLKFSIYEGLCAAKSRWLTLMMWSAISVTLGPLMTFFGKTTREFTNLNRLVHGLKWANATYFVVPAIMYHPGNALAAIHESSRMMLNYAGKRAHANYSLAWPIFTLRCITLLPGLIAIQHHDPYIAIGISTISACSFTVLSIINSCIHNSMRSALFEFIKTKHVPEGFSEKDLQNAIS